MHTSTRYNNSNNNDIIIIGIIQVRYIHINP